MTDLAVLAFGFGVMPLAALLFYAFPGIVLRHREASWGILAGVAGFLGLSHAMARVLATVLSVLGLAVGAGLGWFLLDGPYIRTEPNRILATSVAFVALHSFGDGLVIGASFLGGVSTTLPLDAVTVSATVVHRFVEGAIVVIPAIAAAWRSRFAFPLLFPALLSVPAAYLPIWLLDVYGFTPVRSVLALSIPTFASAVEATLALFLVARAFLPLASVDRGTRWLVWTVLGFIGISLVHFLVE